MSQTVTCTHIIFRQRGVNYQNQSAILLLSNFKRNHFLKLITERQQGNFKVREILAVQILKKTIRNRSPGGMLGAGFYCTSKATMLTGALDNPPAPKEHLKATCNRGGAFPHTRGGHGAAVGVPKFLKFPLSGFLPPLYQVKKYLLFSRLP